MWQCLEPIRVWSSTCGRCTEHGTSPYSFPSFPFWYYDAFTISPCRWIGHVWTCLHKVAVSYWKIHENIKAPCSKHGQTIGLRGGRLRKGWMPRFHHRVFIQVWSNWLPSLGCKWRIRRCKRGAGRGKNKVLDDTSIERSCPLMCFDKCILHGTLAKVTLIIFSGCTFICECVMLFW